MRPFVNALGFIDWVQGVTAGPLDVWILLQMVVASTECYSWLLKEIMVEIASTVTILIPFG